MTESEAIEKLKNMRLYMQIEDEHNDCKFTEDDYKANEMAIQALEKQIPKKPIINHINTNEDVTEIEYTCSACGTNYVELTPCEEWCPYCGNKIDWSDEE